MRKTWNLRYIFSLVLALMLLASCGGGGSLPPSRPAASISGVAFDAAIVNGTVTVYDYSTGSKGAKLATTTTVAHGRFTLDLTVGSRPVLLEVTSGQYIEEASGELVVLNATQKISAVINYTAGSSSQVTLSYFTHLAAGLAEFLMGTGVEVSAAINQANALVSSMVGTSIIGTFPQDITLGSAEDTELTDSYRYGFLTASLSQWTKWVSEQNGEAAHAQYTSIHFTQLAYDDIRADGRLDGQGAGGALTMGVVELSAEHYRNDIPLHLLRLANTGSNKSALTPADLLSVASTYNSSALAVDVFSGAPPTPLLQLAPVIGALSYANEEIVSGLVLFGADGTDPTGVAQIDIMVDDAVHTSISDFSNPFVTIDSTVLNEGSHTFGVVATNIVGNSSSAAVSLQVINQDAFITKIHPPADSYVRGVFQMSAEAFDPKGLASVQFANEQLGAVDAEVSQPAMAEFDSSTLPDGVHDFSVTATNIVGESIKQAVSYTVDNTVPVAVIDSPVEGALVSGQLAVSGTATDNFVVAKADVLFDGAAVEFSQDNDTVTASVDTSGYEEGERAIALVATDGAGNTVTASALVSVDNTVPIITWAAPSGLLSGAQTTVGADVSDANGIAKTELFLADALLDTKASEASPDFSIDTTTSKDGTVELRLTTTDNAGNQANVTTDVTIDNTPPILSINIPEAVNGNYVSGNISVVGQISDINGILSAELKEGAKSLASGKIDTTTLNAAVDTNTYDNGRVALELQATDQANNFAKISKEIIVDNSPPSVTILQPKSGQAFNSDFNVSANVSDGQGVASVKIDFSGLYVQNPVVASLIQQPIVTADMKEGNYTLKVSTNDLAGNSRSAQVANIYIDRTAPILEIKDTAYVATRTGCTITLNSSDDGSGLESVFVDGRDLGGIEQDGWLAPVDIKNSSRAVIPFSAIDKAGNEISFERCIIKTNDTTSKQSCKSCDL